MRQIVGGLLYLHSHGILHRDLTLSNLLLTSQMDVVSRCYQIILMFVYVLCIVSNTFAIVVIVYVRMSHV
jgi:serine/threonine protein kinase